MQTPHRALKWGHKLLVVSVLLSLLLALGLAPASAAPQAVPSGERLRNLAGSFLIGYASINNFAGISDAAQYQEVARTEFNILTPENQMKFDAIHPSQNSYNFPPADQHVQFAQANDMKVHGHTLVWHNQLPGWVSNGSWNEASLTGVMYDHIDTVMNHFDGQIYVWDVVNEAFNEDGSYRTSLWYNTIGRKYIELAFQRARSADPSAKLIYNDYNIETVNSKSTGAYNMIADFKARGIPIDGIGLQMHLAGGMDYQSFATNMQRFADLGLEIYITEMDVRYPTPISQANLTAQATVYRNVTDRCLAQPACKALQVWGIPDKYSWIPDVFPGQGDALLFDNSYQPKPAYYAVQAALAAINPTTVTPTTVTPTTVTPTTPVPPGGCKVTYTANSWGSGFTAEIKITNDTTSAIQGWTLTYSYANGQQITSSWNATLAQSGANVTASNPTSHWNGNIPANGGSVSFGVQGTHSGTNTTPANFALNGQACNGTATPTTVTPTTVTPTTVTPTTVTPTTVTPTTVTPTTVTPTTVTPTTPVPPGGCKVTYTANSWGSGFTAEIKITNNSTSAIQGWTLTYSYANGQQITSAWNATLAQNGANVTASNPTSHWNGNIPANGGSVSFGVQGTHGGTNTNPASFSLNGVACNGTVTPTTVTPTTVTPTTVTPTTVTPTTVTPTTPPPGAYTGNATYFDALGMPYGGCGITQSALDSQNFVAFNVQDTPGDYTTMFPRPISAQYASQIGVFNNGLNCGRWIRVTISDYCNGINDGAPNAGFCHDGSWVPDAYNGATLDFIVADSCQDANGWCRDDRYHIDLAKAALNLFVKDGQPVGDLYPNHWNNRKVTWEFIEAPDYTGDINIGFLKDAQIWWTPIGITHLQNGIHGVDYYENGAWVKATMNADMGQSYLIRPTTTGGTSYRIRVYDANDQLINNGRIYNFSFPASCGTQCPSPFNQITYTVE